jgi:hypothetical protein
MNKFFKSPGKVEYILKQNSNKRNRDEKNWFLGNYYMNGEEYLS